MNTVSVDRNRITPILQDINNLYAATIESENRRSVLNRIERIHNELAALTQPEQPEPCVNCRGSGITPIGDGYSVDACPQCTPEQPEAGRGEAVAVVHDDDSGGHWVELTDDVKDGDLLYLAPPATAEAVRLVAAFRGFWVTNESGMLERCVATIDAIEKACRDADAFLAQHGGRGDE